MQSTKTYVVLTVAALALAAAAAPAAAQYRGGFRAGPMGGFRAAPMMRTGGYIGASRAIGFRTAGGPRGYFGRGYGWRGRAFATGLGVGLGLPYYSSVYYGPVYEDYSATYPADIGYGAPYPYAPTVTGYGYGMTGYGYGTTGYRFGTGCGCGW